MYDLERPQENAQSVDNEMLQQSLNLMKEAVQGEREDQLFYEYLISQAPTREQKEIIGSIRDDEVKHNKMFRQLYKKLTGMEVPAGTGEEFVRPKSYLDGIQRALFGELKAVEKYRKIRQGLSTQEDRDMLFEIITDEIKHASKYNFLFTLNRTKSTRENTDLQTTEPHETTAENTPSLPDQWVMYLEPLVAQALKEVEEGINMRHLFQEFILAGVLVGNQYTPEDAIAAVEIWERSGESKLLQESKKMSQ